MRYLLDINENNSDSGLVVIIPGVLGYGEESNVVSLAESLVDLGYRVIRFTPQCMVKDPKNQLTNYLQSNIYEEVKSIVESYYTNRNDVENTIVIGISAGGPIATKYGSEFPVKAVVNIASPYQVTNGDDLSQLDWSSGYVPMKSSLLGDVKLPISYKEDSKKFNSLDYIEKVNAPKLFILGDKDEQVPNDLTKSTYEKASEPKQIEIVKGMPHRYKDNNSFIRLVNESVSSFINRL